MLFMMTENKFIYENIAGSINLFSSSIWLRKKEDLRVRDKDI